jgi:recombination associated protein RdgC
MQSRGWVPPGVAPRLLHTINGQHLIALGTEEKLLPSSIIRQEALERAKLIEQEQGYPVGRRQLRELKERVADELRARALTRKRVTRAWVDPAQGWFVVDTSGPARAEELVETLRDSLGSLPVRFLETARSPQAAMAAWLMLGDAPLRFTIEQDLATVRYSRHPLEGKEIHQHLNSGKQATRLGLTWSDRISFVLTDKLQLKRLQFLEIKEQPEQDAGSSISPEEQFDIDFALMSGELSQLLPQLSEALGGEAVKQPQAA